MKIPTVEDLRRLAGTSGLALKDAELLAVPRLPVKYPRERGAAPDLSRNPHNAWAWRCGITDASGGPLSGIPVGIKDNICVVGMSLMLSTKQFCIGNWRQFIDQPRVGHRWHP